MSQTSTQHGDDPPSSPARDLATDDHALAALHRDLERQRVIGPATGLIAGRLGCRLDQACQQLDRLAEAHGVDLLEAASAVLANAGVGIEPHDALPEVFHSGRYLSRVVHRTVPAGGSWRAAAGGGPDEPAAPQSPAGPPGPADPAPPPLAGREVAQTVLEILPGPSALLTPLPGPDGRPADYRLVAANQAAIDIAGRRGNELIGQLVSEAYPTVVGTELWRAYEEVLATGRPRDVGPFTYNEVTAGVPAQAVYSVRVHRLGGDLLIDWVRHDLERRHQARQSQTERLGNLGWAEWDLTTDTIEWSEQLYTIFERDRSAGPLSLEECATLVLPEDRSRLEPALAALLDDGRPMDIVVRIRALSGIKYVRSIFETTRDANGRALQTYGIVQDVTAEKAAEEYRQRLADVEQQLAERQRSLQTEHRLVSALQQVILPLPVRPIDLPGLQVAVRYLPAEELARVGGDWYDVVTLPDGRTLCALGDVAGHGLVAAGAMARLRHAMAALAVTTTEPAELLAYLNRMVCDDPAEPTATVVVARFDPVAATVTWAQAGHPPPLLLASGTVRALNRPAGVIVGAHRDPSYASSTVDLPAGSTMLFYTDGLIERRGPSDGDWLEPVLQAVRGGDAEPLDALLDRLQPANPDDDTCLIAVRTAASPRPS